MKTWQKKVLAVVCVFILWVMAGNDFFSPNKDKVEKRREEIRQEQAERERRAEEERKYRETPEYKAAKEAEQKAAEEKRLAEQKAAEEKKVQEEAERGVRQRELIQAEKYAFQDWKAKLYSGSEAVDEHWESLWQYTLTSASNGQMDAQTVFQNLRELEHNLIEDEMIFVNATVPQEMSEAHAQKMNAVKQGLAQWVRLRRQGCEKFRSAFIQSNTQVMQESLAIINQSDTVLLQSTAKLIALEEEINNR